jgi:hypothetical protein
VTGLQRTPNATWLMVLGAVLIGIGVVAQVLGGGDGLGVGLIGVGDLLIVIFMALRLGDRGEPAARRVSGALGSFIGGGLIAAGVMLTALWGACTLMGNGFLGSNTMSLGQTLVATAPLLPAPIFCFGVGGLILLLSRRRPPPDGDPKP